MIKVIFILLFIFVVLQYVCVFGYYSSSRENNTDRCNKYNRFGLLFSAFSITIIAVVCILIYTGTIKLCVPV